MGGNTVALSQHAQEEMLGADRVVVQVVSGLFLRQNKDPAGAVSEVLEHSYQSARRHRLVARGTLPADGGTHQIVR